MGTAPETARGDRTLAGSGSRIEALAASALDLAAIQPSCQRSGCTAV